MKSQRERFVRKTQEAANKLRTELLKQGRQDIRIHREREKFIVSCERGYVPPASIERTGVNFFGRDELGLLENEEDY